MNRIFETNVLSKKRIGDNLNNYTDSSSSKINNGEKIRITNNQTRDNYEGIDEKTLEKLRKDTILTQNEINELKQELFGNLSKPVQFSLFNDNNENNEDILTVTRYFDIILFYNEFRESVDQLRQNKKLSPIIHKIEEGSILYLKLYSWNKFNIIIDPFIQFINNHVYSKKIPNTFKDEDKKSYPIESKDKKYLPPSANKRISSVDIQNKIIVSHFDKKRYTCIDILDPIENRLDAMIMKITLYKDIILFYFEWSDPLDQTIQNRIR